MNFQSIPWPSFPPPPPREKFYFQRVGGEYCANFRDLAGEGEEGHLGGSVTGRENVERNDRKQIPLDEREMNI